MEREVQDFFKDFTKAVQKMGKDIPDTVRSFLALFEKTTQPGALDTKQKELIALGIAVAQHCVPCIYIHTGCLYFFAISTCFKKIKQFS